MNTDLATRLRDHARDAALFPEPGRVLLAVSGGPDSLAMLDLMVRVAPELEIQLAVAHVDHGIADESPDVAEHVLGLAVRYNLPGYLVTLKLGRTASETAARSGRYAALRSMQQRTGSRYLATAHHADDQIETILLRIFRGTGVAGLAGIPDTGPGGLVRPLLPFVVCDVLQRCDCFHGTVRDLPALQEGRVGGLVGSHAPAAPPAHGSCQR